jgi:Na+-transporting methylmalonyl-CoA/oxaloacetate decarboxylase gamma subunit
MNEATILALKISGIGLAGVFLFMTIFYFVIIGIDKLFPTEDKLKKKLPIQPQEGYEDEFH